MRAFGCLLISLATAVPCVAENANYEIIRRKYDECLSRVLKADMEVAKTGLSQTLA